MGNNIEVMKSTCKSCHGSCGVLVEKKEGKITRITGNPHSPTKGTMCAKGLASIQEITNPSRLNVPLLRKGERGSGKWEQISWERAMDIMVEKMSTAINENGPEAIAITQGTGRGYNRYTFRFARSIGTPNVGLPAHFCYGPRLAVFGNMVGGRLYCDYHGWGGEYPKTQISWGKQIEITNADGEMAVWFLKSLEACKNLIVVDPRATRLTERATLWLQIRPGTDAALALGMLHVIINEELYDKDFVANWTHGFEELKARVQEYPVDKVSDITWIPEEKIIQAARMLAMDTPGCIQTGESLEASINAIQTLSAITSLAAITGNIERPGGMVNWIPPATGPMEDFSIEVPSPKGTAIGADTYRLLSEPPFAMCHMPTLFKQLKDGTSPIRYLHIQGSNPLVAYENTKDVLAGLKNAEFITVADLFMTPTAEMADLVLPVAHWLEGDDIYDMHPRFMIGAINKVVEPLGESWPDNKIFNELGKRLAPEWWFDDVEQMLDHQLRKAHVTWKEFSQMGHMSYEGADQPYYKYKTDYWKEGGGFGTPTGKVELYMTIMDELGYDPLPYYREPPESPYSSPELFKQYPLVLSTGGRVPYYFHSQYRQTPLLRERQPNPLIQIHPDKARELGIQDGDWVWIETPRGRIQQVARLYEGLDPRVVVVQASWWYPEDPTPEHGMWKSNANVLTNNEPPFDSAIGATSLRSLLCKVYKVEEA